MCAVLQTHGRAHTQLHVQVTEVTVVVSELRPSLCILSVTMIMGWDLKICLQERKTRALDSPDGGRSFKCSHFLQTNDPLSASTETAIELDNGADQAS